MRSPLLVQRQRPFDRTQEALAVPAAHAGKSGGERIAADARYRVRRILAGHGTVEHAAHRVEVGPGPLFAVAGVLFERRVAGREDRGQTACLATECLARGTEVDQHRVTVGAHEDVVGLDVAMQEPGSMHCRKPLQQRRDESLEFCLNNNLMNSTPKQTGLETRGEFRFRMLS